MQMAGMEDQAPEVKSTVGLSSGVTISLAGVAATAEKDRKELHSSYAGYLS